MILQTSVLTFSASQNLGPVSVNNNLAVSPETLLRKGDIQACLLFVRVLIIMSVSVRS